MPALISKSLGTLTYQDADVIHFPLGIAAFEDCHRFLTVERPESHPLVFLQSLDRPDLFFIAVPVHQVDQDYDLLLLDEYCQVLGLTEVTGSDLLVLAVLCFPHAGTVTANLLGPLVIHCPTGRGVQAIRDDARYSATHPLSFEDSPCS